MSEQKPVRKTLLASIINENKLLAVIKPNMLNIPSILYTVTQLKVELYAFWAVNSFWLIKQEHAADLLAVYALS